MCCNFQKTSREHLVGVDQSPSHAAISNSWLLMTPLILYGYCQGIYSSWRPGRACGERFDFMAIVEMDRLNFWAVNKFRKRDLDALRGMFATLVLGTPKHCAKDDPEQDGGQEAAADKWKPNVDTLPSGSVYPRSPAAGTSSRTTLATGYCWYFTGT